MKERCLRFAVFFVFFILTSSKCRRGSGEQRADGAVASFGELGAQGDRERPHCVHLLHGQGREGKLFSLILFELLPSFRQGAMEARGASETLCNGGGGTGHGSSL